MLGLLLPVALPQVTFPIRIIPRPASMVARPGGISVDADMKIVAGKGLKGEAEFLREAIMPWPNRRFGIARSSTRAITLSLDPTLKALGDEGYRLSVHPNGVDIKAAKPAGVFYGIQTLRQMFVPDSFGKPVAQPLLPPRLEGPSLTLPVLPFVEIEDKPRFSWRGMHLDTARHFMPKEAIFKFLDLMALHKLNSFHWHLTDDQGWRIEIKRYPKLTSVGARRKDTMLTYSPPTFSGQPHGGFYTQKDAKEIVAYAAARHIAVVPEIEMPGHAQAAIAAYPELGNLQEKLEVFTQWGVNENIFNVEDGTIRFLKNVLDEIMAIFPSRFIHVGGDEVPKVQWKRSPAAQGRMKALGLKNEEELQSWFIHQMDEHLTRKGRRLIGWDEILEGGLAPGAAVMSWRGIDGGVAAAKAGHDVVMAANDSLYFDYFQSKDRAKEPRGIGGYLPLDKVYRFEPVPAALNAEEAKSILGAQAQIWTEYISSFGHVEYMAYPRAAALAEVVWSPANGKDFTDFSNRLAIHVERLKALDVNFRPLDGPVSSDGVWKSGEIGEEWTSRTWTITRPLKPGVYNVLFSYSGGAHRLDIAQVEALQGETVLARDVHPGRAGAEDVNNRYRLDLSKLTPGEPIVLRARVRADGGNDSAGEVFLNPAE
ncbi:beta-N-acetylhexosaminidase [bacterium]|nr:MAG: beta-N-acetylhexosaminidase [bacterium]